MKTFASGQRVKLVGISRGKYTDERDIPVRFGHIVEPHIVCGEANGCYTVRLDTPVYLPGAGMRTDVLVDGKRIRVDELRRGQ